MAPGFFCLLNQRNVIAYTRTPVEIVSADLSKGYQVMNQPYYLLLADAPDGIIELIFSDFSLDVVLDEMNDERETLADQGYTHLRISSQMRDEREAWDFEARVGRYLGLIHNDI